MIFLFFNRFVVNLFIAKFRMVAVLERNRGDGGAYADDELPYCKGCLHTEGEDFGGGGHSDGRQSKSI